ncbi:MAG: HAMP domain-containing protein [Nitrospirae bacterium]|nr:HAMP domain-containing protein [Nitrospirota bacterium]
MVLKNVKISHKLIFMTAVALVVLLSFGGIWIYMGKSQLESLRNVYNEKMTPLDNLRSMQLIFRELDYQMVGVISAAESSQEAAVHLEKSLQKLKKLWSKTEPQLSSEVFGNVVANFKKNLRSFYALARKLKDAYKSDDIDSVDLIHEQWIDLKSEIFKAVDTIAEQQKRLTEGFYNKKEQIINRVIVIILAATVLSMVVFLVLSFIIVRSIGKPVNSVVEASREIAAGDLTKRIAVSSRDEMGLMAGTLNGMIERLNRLCSGISDNISRITRQSEKLSRFSENMQTGINQQTGQIEQVASAASEMSQTIIDMAQNASYSSDAAQTSYDTAQKGMEVVREVVEDIQSLAREINDASERLQMLGKRSEEIGEILMVIQDIADQTNLLALNAAIEAARAGEQGRGFAVVADEVRKLAEKTAQATDDIADKIRAIQDETEMTIAVMKRGTDSFKESVEKATHAGNALKEIVESSGQVMEMVQRIATATEEQSSAAEQVSQSMEVVAGIVRDNATQVDELRSLADELLNIANKLSEQIGQFKLGKGYHGKKELSTEEAETQVDRMEMPAPTV